MTIMKKIISDTSNVNISMTLDVQILLLARTSSLPILRPGIAVNDRQTDRQIDLYIHCTTSQIRTD